MHEVATEWASIVAPALSRGWRDIKFIQAHWGGPTVLKGIQNVGDCPKCVEMGLRGIVASNHCKSQVGGAPAGVFNALLPPSATRWIYSSIPASDVELI